VVCVTCLAVSEEVGSPKRSCAVDTSPSDDCPDDDDDTPAPPEGGDEPCGLDCWEPIDDDDPMTPPGFMSAQAWQTTSSGMAVAFYQPASAGCPGDEGPPPNPWAKAMQIGNKILQAADRGEDLLDAKTWKNMLQSEWADAAQAGLDTQAALNGDVIALIGVLDYIADQVVGFGFFDMLQGLKIADRLGLGWYDEVMGYLQGSWYAGELVNRIGNLESIEAIATQGQKLFGKWVMPDGTSTSQIISTFEAKWNTSAEILDGSGRMRLFSPDGSVVMTRYPSTNTSYWGIDINFVDDNRILKIRANE